MYRKNFHLVILLKIMVLVHTKIISLQQILIINEYIYHVFKVNQNRDH